MFGLFSKEDPNLKRNRKTQQLREEQWREHWQEQRSPEPKPVRPPQKRSTQVIRFR